MNTVVTSKEAILHTCREMVSEKGLSSLHMRAVAARCGIALGSLYNYYPSKNELILAVIESVWQDIFHMDHRCAAKKPFPAYVDWIFDRVRAGMTEYPNFFTAHSISFAGGEKGKARQTMEDYFGHMKIGMHEALKNDASVRANAFDADFSESDFLDFVLLSVLSLLMQQRISCAPLLEMIRRTLY